MSIQKFIGLALLLITYLLRPMYRFRYTGKENLQLAKSMGPLGAYSVAFLHEHLFGAGLGHITKRYSIMISASKDGEIATMVAKGFGFVPVRGSSSRGGLHAKNEMLLLLKSGVPAALTVDGPRGPRRLCKMGIINLAKNANIAIVPMACACKRQWVFHKSWDKFKLPKPFSTIVIHYGKPLLVDTKSSDDTIYAGKVIQGICEAEEQAQQSLRP
ncbi:MAG: lysophospholipid acyltransferase family protein [Oligoflexia bacterium]|nr:lysophospholipid acyltransferase family protein [Oligoflexia bacterium]